MVAGILIDRKVITKKTSIILGTLIFIIGTHLQQKLDLEMSKIEIVAYLMPWGIGMGFFFPALSQISLGSFKGELLRQASSIQNLMRLVGGSVGTAVSTYILLSSQQVHFVRLTERVSSSSPQVVEFLRRAGNFFHYFRSEPPQTATQTAHALLAQLFSQHAFWHSFADAFFFATICGVLTLIPAFLLEERDESSGSGFTHPSAGKT